MRAVTQDAAARRAGSGERARLACLAMVSRHRKLFLHHATNSKFRFREKPVSARRRNQHARRVRSPEIRTGTRSARIAEELLSLTVVVVIHAS